MLTRDEAIARIVDLDVGRWGEGERESSRRLRSKLSHGRALNTLAHYDVDHVDSELARQAAAIMTDQDRRELEGLSP